MMLTATRGARAAAAAAPAQRRAALAFAAAPRGLGRGRPAVLVRAEERDRTKDLSDVTSPREAVPRVAPAFQAPPLLPVFSRRREIWSGRLAMVGIAAAAAWEIFLPSHPGPMSVTSALTGLSIPTVKLLFGGFVAHGLLGLLWPGSPTFDRANAIDYSRRPEGPPGKVFNPITQPAKFFGCSPHFGFTKKNELLHGRLAMLGFLAAVINESTTGLGPIGQVAWWMGSIAPGDSWYRNAGLGLAAFALLMTAAAYSAGHSGTLQGEDEIY